MTDRQFSETDLRQMFAQTVGIRKDVEVGRWIVSAAHHGATWEIVVEPDEAERHLVVVTAYVV